MKPRKAVDDDGVIEQVNRVCPSGDDLHDPFPEGRGSVLVQPDGDVRLDSARMVRHVQEQARELVSGIPALIIRPSNSDGHPPAVAVFHLAHTILEKEFNLTGFDKERLYQLQGLIFTQETGRDIGPVEGARI